MVIGHVADGNDHPPRQLAPPPEGANAAAFWLLRAWNEASAGIPAWPASKSMGTVGWRRQRVSAADLTSSAVARAVAGTYWTWGEDSRGIEFRRDGALVTPWDPKGTWGLISGGSEAVAGSGGEEDGIKRCTGCLFADFAKCALVVPRPTDRAGAPRKGQRARAPFCPRPPLPAPPFARRGALALHAPPLARTTRACSTPHAPARAHHVSVPACAPHRRARMTVRRRALLCENRPAAPTTICASTLRPRRRRMWLSAWGIWRVSTVSSRKRAADRRRMPAATDASRSLRAARSAAAAQQYSSTAAAKHYITVRVASDSC